jgi:hypothetical protein
MGATRRYRKRSRRKGRREPMLSLRTAVFFARRLWRPAVYTVRRAARRH